MSKGSSVGEKVYLISKDTNRVVDIFPSRATDNYIVRELYEKIFGLEEGSFVSVVKSEVHNHV